MNDMSRETTWNDVYAVGDRFRTFDQPWAIAGGWALDCFLGEQTRSHGDAEVAVFREDQHALREHLSDWTFEVAVPGEERTEPWATGEWLELPRHELHARNEAFELPHLECLLNEHDGERWTFRRDSRVTRDLEKVVRVSETGMPYLAPDIVLCYKLPIFGEHDEADFDRVFPQLAPEPRGWLREAILTVDPDHHWLRAFE
ncbi:nucleotidyltransferase domain-containing protein [Haloarchaeobius sp. DYHT-AS-18]|uniref:nucleotidyltransferase domain-containing protein n=1 Tax=Haloarchaeobius sp. DYHT-AS-18 TaxID=3446117 RepID=UPI003EB926DA